MNYVVYELICPIENTVKYVGMSRNVHDRYRAHRKGDEDSTREFSKRLKAKNLKPILKVVAWDMEKREAINFERELTRFYMNAKNSLLNTYLGTTPVTKKVRESLLPRQEKMAKTRKIQCQGGAEKERLLSYNEKRKKPIVDQHGDTYESLREAERKTGCFRASINKVIRGEWSQTNGYIFKRAS